MPLRFASDAYDPELVKLMGDALETAWAKLDPPPEAGGLARHRRGDPRAQRQADAHGPADVQIVQIPLAMREPSTEDVRRARVNRRSTAKSEPSGMRQAVSVSSGAPPANNFVGGRSCKLLIDELFAHQT
jgi:hypothetical protein